MDSYRPPTGTPVRDLDTPCLLVDLDALEHNYGLIADTYRNTACKMRQHIKNVKSPVVSQMQIRTGGTVGGVCAAKVSEAEVMVEGGVGDVLITSQVAARDKMARLCSLAKGADVKVAVDDGDNLRQWSEVAQLRPGGWRLGAGAGGGQQGHGDSHWQGPGGDNRVRMDT